MDITNILKTTAKFLTALVAAIGVAITVLPEGITLEEWLTIGIAFTGAIGVYSIPNKTSK